jgi:hypothetical protein
VAGARPSVLEQMHASVELCASIQLAHIWHTQRPATDTASCCGEPGDWSASRWLRLSMSGSPWLAGDRSTGPGGGRRDRRGVSGVARGANRLHARRVILNRRRNGSSAIKTPEPASLVEALSSLRLTHRSADALLSSLLLPSLGTLVAVAHAPLQPGDDRSSAVLLRLTGAVGHIRPTSETPHRRDGQIRAHDCAVAVPLKDGRLPRGLGAVVDAKRTVPFLRLPMRKSDWPPVRLDQQDWPSILQRSRR